MEHNLTLRVVHIFATTKSGRWEGFFFNRGKRDKALDKIYIYTCKTESQRHNWVTMWPKILEENFGGGFNNGNCKQYIFLCQVSLPSYLELKLHKIVSVLDSGYSEPKASP